MSKYFYLKDDKTKIFKIEDGILESYNPEKNEFIKNGINIKKEDLMPIDQNEDINYFYYYNLAYNISKKAHKGQKDKTGRDYFTAHVLEITKNVNGKNQRIAALLHDVVEDTDVNISDLKKYGFSDLILNAVNVLTRKDNEDYFSYIKNLKNNKIARDVKLADLMKNSDINHFKIIRPEDIKRREKYIKAIEILKEN